MRSINASDRAAFLRARIGVARLVEQHSIRSSTGARSTPFSNGPLSTSMLRASTAAQSGVRPYQSLDVDLRAPIDQEARDVHVVVGDRHQQRRDAVGIGPLDVAPAR